MNDLSKFKVAKAFQHLDPNQGLADGIAAGFPSIRYKGKAWALSLNGTNYPFKRDDDGSPLTYIDTIILGISPGLSKAYFGQEQWTEESSSGPICTSLRGDVPDPGTPIPQAKTCGICSHNEWITKPAGGRGKECQDHKRMAVLLMPAMTKKMLGSPLMEPVHLKIPPASLKSLKKFSDALQHQGIPFAAVVTRISFSQERIFEMVFNVVQALTDAEAPRVLPLMDDNQTRAIVGGSAAVRELPPPRKVVEERVDTGIMEAFGAPTKAAPAARRPAPAPQQEVEAPPAPRPRGRPRAAPPQTIDNEPPPPAEVAAPAPGAGDTPGDWDESDTDLDDTVAKLMGDKMSKMLK